MRFATKKSNYKSTRKHFWYQLTSSLLNLKTKQKNPFKLSGACLLNHKNTFLKVFFAPGFWCSKMYLGPVFSLFSATESYELPVLPKAYHISFCISSIYWSFKQSQLYHNSFTGSYVYTKHLWQSHLLKTWKSLIILLMYLHCPEPLIVTFTRLAVLPGWSACFGNVPFQPKCSNQPPCIIIF